MSTLGFVGNLVSGKKKRRQLKKEEEQRKIDEQREIAQSGPPLLDPSEIELGDLLGHGAFGAVYKGVCRGSQVAIKVPIKQDLNDQDLADVKKEVDIMSKVFHPNVALFMGASVVPGKFMIVSEMLDGDLETLLKDTTRHLGLVQRIKMAKDAAQGLAWLHGNNPCIVHRDIKSANFLVDKNLRLKVCDFGLSQLKNKDAALRDQKGKYIGSPLWMAPEVLQNQPLDEKADVYSFGIVLWEILTRKEPFPHHDDFNRFRRAVVEQGERPPMPDDAIPSLRKLIDRCWAARAVDRPRMAEVSKELEGIIVDAALQDDNAQVMWKSIFGDQEEIAWVDFVDAVFAYLKVNIPPLPSQPTQNDILMATDRQLIAFAQSQGRSRAVLDELAARGIGELPKTDIEAGFHNMSNSEKKFNSLKALCAVKDTDGYEVVRMERFGQILGWFGPFGVPYEENADHFLDRIVNTLSTRWFHGDVSTNEANNRLRTQAPGTFLIRFSTNPKYPRCFAVSKVSSNNQVVHVRLTHPSEHVYILADGSKFKSLDDVVLLAHKLRLQNPCPGSMYQFLFDNEGAADLGGYQMS